jgi:solute carrier family 25 folate transporter 32
VENYCIQNSLLLFRTTFELCPTNPNDYQSVASTATYPLQVMKARLQQRSQAIEVSETTGEIIVAKREYSGVIDCAKKIWRNEGIYGFFKGCVTNAIRVAPSAAVTFVTYEFVLDMLTDIN